MKKQNYYLKLFVAAALLASTYSMPICVRATMQGVEAACRSSSADDETVNFLLVWDRSGDAPHFRLRIILA